jgi:4-hydroxy-3-methylbut-2-enyl diphosphate reductase
MQIERARELGLCYGVRRAIDMLREAVARHGPLETLGPVAHNRVLVHELTALGVTSVDSLDRILGPVVVISAHGVAPSVTRELEERGLTIVDTTCPTVARAQRVAEGLATEGFTIVIFGDADHTEVKGLLGWAGERSLASLGVAGLPLEGRAEGFHRVAVISQTTQRLAEFTSFVQELCAKLLQEGEELRVVNTLCSATQRRQESAAELARRVEVMFVIGGHHSANTRRLADTCSALVETYHIETADEIEEARVKGKGHVGITAGASTPDSSIELVELRLRGL